MWSKLVEEVVEFPTESKDKAVLFNKLIEIWNTNAHTINRRLVAVVKVAPESEEFKTLATGKRGEVYRFIPKAAIFSSKCYQIVESFSLHEAYIYEFKSIQLDEEDSDLKHPHIPIDYRIIFDRTSDLLSIEVKQGQEMSAKWLKETVFPNLVRLMKSAEENRGKKPHVSTIDIEQYSKTYQRIKLSIGKSIVESWTEKTDPHKFVYEDCALTAYLKVLFRETDSMPKKFVDVGCGNGLLVKLLKEEGITGVGVDIRKRNIWDEFIAQGVQLCEASLDPQTASGMPEGADYLIGNHSDELTPWIPIMAARLKCSFFLLPCCPFDFYCKYSKVKGASGESQYVSYMAYIRSIITKLGFEFKEDRLRIPSTKRHAFIATIPSGGLPENIDEIIEQLTKKGETFVPRAKTIESKNCSNLPADFRIALMKKIFTHLMSLDAANDKGWRCGGSMSLAKLAEILTVDEKELLKNQNGGLQTFLKNHHQIFKVIGGKVKIKNWREELELAPLKKNHVKKSECWFLRNHPDGCPLSEETCRFAH